MAHFRHLRSGVVVASLLAGASSCNRSSEGTASPSPQGGTVPQAAAAPIEMPIGAAPQEPAQSPMQSQVQPSFRTKLDVSNLDDASLAAVMQSLHERIAQEAQLAEGSAQDAEVKRLSYEVGALHSDVMATDQTVLQRANILPRVSPVSQQIDDDAANTLRALRNDRGAAFDRDYLDAESRALQESIQLFDRMLAVAKGPEVKAEITRNRPDLVANEESVSKLQHSLRPGVTSQQAK
jgi:predicted outer membrane protein